MHSEKGQGLMEYSLILVIVAIGVVVVVYFYGQEVRDIYQFLIVDKLLPAFGG